MKRPAKRYTARALRSRFANLLAELRQRNKEYEEFSITERKRAVIRVGSMLDANRYEGIARGTRWALEDLLEFLQNLK